MFEGGAQFKLSTGTSHPTSIQLQRGAGLIWGLIWKLGGIFLWFVNVMENDLAGDLIRDMPS